MTREDVIEAIGETLASILDEDQIKMTGETSADDVEGWDSIAHVKLIIALEKRFKVRFESNEIAAPETVGELADLILTKAGKS